MEAERLRHELCEALAFAAPLTWETIRFKVQSTVLTSTASTSVVNRDGTPGSFVFPDGFMRKVDQFRAACYEPGRGTWYSAAITLREDSEPEIALYYDEEPAWDAWPHPWSFVRDLEFFPRDEEHLPDWLREQVELAAGQVPEGPERHPTTTESKAKPAREQHPPREQHNVVRQKEVLDQLTATLLESLPADWQRLVIEYRVVGRHSDARIGLLKQDDQVHYWDPPLEAWHRFQDLRRAMYLADEGTWFGAQYKLIRPARFAVKYNWHIEPDFSSAPAPDEFAIEQSRFPRAEAHQPNWYRAGLAKANAVEKGR